MSKAARRCGTLRVVWFFPRLLSMSESRSCRHEICRRIARAGRVRQGADRRAWPATVKARNAAWRVRREQPERAGGQAPAIRRHSRFLGARLRGITTPHARCLVLPRLGRRCAALSYDDTPYTPPVPFCLIRLQSVFNRRPSADNRLYSFAFIGVHSQTAFS